jgi:hypothetical protein
MNAQTIFFTFRESLYLNEPAEFRSDFALDESIKRLHQVIRPTIFHTLFKQSAVGRVSETEVRVKRHIPLFSNSFKPIYVGTFEATPAAVVLKGTFTTFMFSKLFMTVWFGFVALWTTVTFVFALAVLAIELLYPSAFDSNPQILWVVVFPLFGLGLFAFGYCILRFARWLSRGDIDFLSERISGALAKSA